MASNVCFRGATGRLALGHAPSPAQSSPAPAAPAPRPPAHPARGLCVQGHDTEADWEAWLRDRRSNPSAGVLSSARRGTAGPRLGTAVAGFGRQNAVREMCSFLAAGAKATHLGKMVPGGREPSCSAAAGTSGSLALGTQAAVAPRRFSNSIFRKKFHFFFADELQAWFLFLFFF